MGNTDIQCLFIGQQSKLYVDLQKSLREFDVQTQVKLVDDDEKHIRLALKKLRGIGLLFISDDIHISLNDISDLVWQHAPDVIVVLITDQAKLTIAKKTIKNIQFSRLHFQNGSDKTKLFLQCILQSVQFKIEFRRCKRLLGISEKRCQWLVESSREAIAYITRDLHLFANASYLDLFNAESLQKLRSISIKDLIDKSEYPLFKVFLEAQLRHYDANRSLVVSMKKSNGVPFRANIHLIPSVYQGKKCLQLWASKLDAFPEESIPVDEQATKTDSKKKNEADVSEKVSKTDDVVNKEVPNPFSILGKNIDAEEPFKVDSSTIIREIIKRKEASLSAQRLVSMKESDNVNDHCLLSLVMNEEQKKGVENLLFKPETAASLEQKSVFWDKVKFARLFQVLREKSMLNKFLVIDVSIASIVDKPFNQWLISEVSKLNIKASRLVFLLPLQFSNEQKQIVADFSQRLKRHHCKVALNDFLVSTPALNVLKLLRPDYIRLSLEWINRIEGQDNREISLGRAIRQLESKDISVIIPNGVSSPMCKNFSLAGASFCQEKAIR